MLVEGTVSTHKYNLWYVRASDKFCGEKQNAERGSSDEMDAGQDRAQ